MLQNFRKNFNLCNERLSSSEFNKKIFFSLLLAVSAALLAFLTRRYIETNINDDPITHIFVGLSIGFVLITFIPFIKICIPYKWIEYLIYIGFIVMWIIFLENEKDTGLRGQELDISFNLIGTILSLFFYKLWLNHKEHKKHKV